jgi:long-chain acyl-CoA synthetase
VVVAASGENIYPDDVEAKVGKVPFVTEYALVGVTADGGGERLACLAVPDKDDSLTRQARLERAQKALRDAFSKVPYAQQPGVIHLVDAALPRTATKKVKRPAVRELLEKTIAATSRHEGDGRVSSVRKAIAAVRGRPEGELSAETTLQAELAFDSLSLTELQVALEARYGAVDPAELHACVTVGDVEHLVEGRRSLLPQKSRTRSIEGRVTKGGPERPFEMPEEVKDLGKRLIGHAQDAFYGGVMTAKVTGQAFIPHNRNTIVVSNHASHLDMGLVRHALGKYGEDIVSLAAQDYFFEKDGLRKTFFENFTNLAPLDRKASLLSAERRAAKVLEQGKTMLIFPEGTRSPDGELQEFKALVGHLALAYGVDILPLWLGGTREALPKGSVLVPRKRELVARIGPPLCVSDLRRLTRGMTPADAARETARLMRQAVAALKDGRVMDLARMTEREEPKEQRHPLVVLFEELGTKFKASHVDKPVSWYFTLGDDALAKWTVQVTKDGCEIAQGKPKGGTADCVLKTSTDIFTKIVREAYMPGVSEFLSGAIKSNDIELLQTFQKVFELGA